jgi:hypothetical protein
MPDPARAATPKPVWNPECRRRSTSTYVATRPGRTAKYDNAFKVEWELFLRHVVDGGPFQWNLL